MSTSYFYRSTPFTWRELLDMILTHRRELILANIIAILGTLAIVPIPMLIPILVEEVVLNQPGTIVMFINSIFPNTWHGAFLYIGIILTVILLLRFCHLIMEVWQLWQFTHISKDVIFRMRQMLLRRLERVSMAEYETLGSSTVASLMVTDLDTVDRFIGNTASKFIVAILKLVGMTFVLLWMHWQLALVILLFNPLIIYIATIFGRRVKILKAQQNLSYQTFQEVLAETLDGIQQIRANNREGYYVQRTIDSAELIRDHSVDFTWQSEAASRMSFMALLLGMDLFKSISMLMVLYSGLSIGQMLAIFAYLWFMMAPMQKVLGMQYAWTTADAALERINNLIKIPLEPQYPHLHNPFAERRTVSIQVQDLAFAYGDGPLILHNLSLEIPNGQKVALVGASGGGKTTFVQVLLGLYSAHQGCILYQGQPIEKIGMNIVRNHVAIVLQHPVLFNDTVRMNLTLGRPIADSLIWQALEIAQLKEVILALPASLDALIGRNGVRLSGGERQRLAIARMVLTNPKLVILDEATSALDTVTERRLHHALQTFLQGRTTLIVAHRLSAVKQADRVLVFEDGHIVEDGNHKELLQEDGFYADLYRKQHVAA